MGFDLNRGFSPSAQGYTMLNTTGRVSLNHRFTDDVSGTAYISHGTTEYTYDASGAASSTSSNSLDNIGFGTNVTKTLSKHFTTSGGYSFSHIARESESYGRHLVRVDLNGRFWDNSLVVRVFLNFPLCLFLVFAISLLSARNDDPSILRDPTGYKLRSGDRIKVSVLGEADCNIEGTINNDERVRLAYIGELPLANMNTKQAETYIAQEYRRQLIFRDPKVTVAISKYVERFVFLSGSVNKQGAYAFPPEAEAMNIVQVIARAGGFTDIANKTKVKVTRTFYDESGKIKNSKTYEINVEALSSGSAANGEYTTFMIYPGDQIFVKERLVWTSFHQRALLE